MMLSHSSWPLRLHRGLEESIGPVIAPADVAQEINITIHVARESRFTGLASCRTGPSPGGIPQTERTRWSVEAESLGATGDAYDVSKGEVKAIDREVKSVEL
jgi:hypothetical protein